VQAASVALAKQWGKLQEQWVTAEMRASEQFFSRTFEPMPRARRQPAPVQASSARPLRGGCRRSMRVRQRGVLRLPAPPLSGMLAGA
jgi:hypothetical protein